MVFIRSLLYLPPLVYRWETWSLTLLRVFDNWMQKRIFGSKEQVRGDWGKLHIEIRILYSSLNEEG
jgi:hypothetical protein